MRKMILYRLCLLLLAIGLLVVSSSSVHAQEYSYINYDVKDGLPSSTVYDVVQDKEGFIWFATENGLSRYDGKRFTNYTIADSLPDNEILKLYVDSKNRVWIMPFKAEICYWYRGRLYTRHNDPLLKKLKLKANVFGLREDKEGNLIISEHVIFHIVRTNNSIETIKAIDGKPVGGHISGVDENGDIKMIVGLLPDSTSTTATFYDYYPILGKKKPIKDQFWEDNRISLIAPGALIYQQTQHLLRIKLKGIDDTLSLPRNSTRLSYLDNGSMAINSETGAILYDIKTKESIRPLPYNISVLSSFLDTEKNYWFGTMGNGVYMVPSLDFRNQILNKDRPAIWALLRMNDRLYVGGDRYLWSASLQDLKFSKVNFNSEGEMTESTKILTLADYKGSLIIGPSSGRVVNNFLNATSYGGSLKHVSIKDNRILYSTHVAAFVYDVLTNKREVIWFNRTTCGIEADSGYYIGTLDGLYFRSYGQDSVFFGRHYPFFNNRIGAITLAPDGTILVGVKGGGLAGLRKGHLIFHLTEKDGLSNNSPTAIHVAGNIIWVGTEKGLNRVENRRGNFEITSFTRSDGLLSDPINAIATSGDTVFVGSSKGLTYFVPEKIARRSECILQFTGIYVSGKYWAYDSSNFSLAHSDNNLSFNFSAISFKSAGNVTFYYRLLGLHSDWRSTRENNLNFTTLPSGNYTLQLKAINKYGVESKTEEISFTIQKLFWEKTGFRLFAIALLAAAIWLFIRYRINKIRQKESEKNRMNKRITELEQSALRSQMNPHFIFNSLNSIQQYVVERDISGANKFITDFSHLIRMTLDYSSKSSIRLSEEIRYIDTYLRLEKTRLEEKFDYQINIAKGIQPDEYSIPSLLLQPFVENSIRHGVKYRNDSNGLIQINISQNEKGLLITIEDNGIGRKTANRYRSEHHVQYQSKGMLLSSGRIDLLNSHGDERIDLHIIDMYDDQEKPTGTRVELLLFTQKTNDN